MEINNTDNAESKKNISERWLDRIAEQLLFLAEKEDTIRSTYVHIELRLLNMEEMINISDMLIDDISSIIPIDFFNALKRQIVLIKEVYFKPTEKFYVSKIVTNSSYKGTSKKRIPGTAFNPVVVALSTLRKDLVTSLKSILYVTKEDIRKNKEI